MSGEPVAGAGIDRCVVDRGCPGDVLAVGRHARRRTCELDRGGNVTGDEAQHVREAPEPEPGLGLGPEQHLVRTGREGDVEPAGVAHDLGPVDIPVHGCDRVVRSAGVDPGVDGASADVVSVATILADGRWRPSASYSIRTMRPRA